MNNAGAKEKWVLLIGILMLASIFGVFLWANGEKEKKLFASVSGELAKKKSDYEMSSNITTLRALVVPVGKYVETKESGSDIGLILDGLKIKISSYCQEADCRKISESHAELKNEEARNARLKSVITRDGVKQLTLICNKVFPGDDGQFLVHCARREMLFTAQDIINSKVVLVVDKEFKMDPGFPRYYNTYAEEIGIQEVIHRSGRVENHPAYKKVNIEWDEIEKSDRRLLELKAFVADNDAEYRKLRRLSAVKVLRSAEDDVEKLMKFFKIPYSGVNRKMLDAEEVSAKEILFKSSEFVNFNRQGQNGRALDLKPGIWAHDLLKSRYWDDQVVSLTGEYYELFKEGMIVNGLTEINGDWMVGSGNAPHSGGYHNSIFAISMSSGMIYGASLIEGNKLIGFGFDSWRSAPKPIYDWALIFGRQ